MAAPVLRVGRMCEQHLRLESSFGMLRGRPSVMDFCTKSGNPKKPVRYTSIKKAKPKTIIDIGKLIMQRANDSKSRKQSVVAEAALKAATQSARHPALKQSTMPRVATASGSSESVIPVAANTPCDSLKNRKPEVTDARKPLAMSTYTATTQDLFDAATSGEQGYVPVNVGQEKVPAPAGTNSLAPEASSSLEFSPLAMSFEGRTTDCESVSDEMASSKEAIPETHSGAVPVPIDVTYSEEVTSVEDAFAKPTVGALSTPGVVTTEMVGEVFVPKMSPAENGVVKPTQVPKGSEIISFLEGSASMPSPTSEVPHSVAEVSQTQIQDGGPLQTSVDIADIGCASSSLETFVEEGAVASESVQKVQAVPDSVLEPEVSPLVLHDNTVIEETCLEKMSDASFEKNIISDSSSMVILVERANQQTTSETPTDLKCQAENKVAVVKKSMDQDPEQTNGDKEGEAVREPEAQQDPIKRLFLDKIREYSTKSKAHDGPVDAGPEYEKAFSEELAKLQRLYGNGDLTAFPEFQFPEPLVDEMNPKEI